MVVLYVSLYAEVGIRQLETYYTSAMVADPVTLFCYPIHLRLDIGLIASSLLIWR